jgi:hypothetical protein
MEAHWGVDVYIHMFFTSALDGVSTHWIGGWADPGVSVDMEKRKILTPLGLEF